MSLLALGCDSESPADLPAELTWQSAHFRYFARGTDTAICADLLASLEEHFQLLQSRVGFSWPSGKTVHYYKYADSEDFLTHAPCPRGSAGCAIGTQIFSYHPFEQHELVHAYLYPTGQPPPLLSEGAAVALACNLAIPEVPALAPGEAVSVGRALEDPRIYQTGGRLVRYLLDRFAAESFLRLYRRLGQEAGLADLDRELRSIYGAGTEELWAAVLATGASCPEPYACSRPSLPLDGTTAMVAPICGLYGAQRVLGLAAQQVLAIASPEGVLLRGCDPVPFADLKLTVSTQGTSPVIGLVRLPAGRYQLAFHAASPATAITATVPPSPWAGTDCGALQPFVVAANENPSLSIWLPVGEPTWIVRLRFEAARRLAVRGSTSNTASLTATVCPDCDFTSAQCQTANLAKDVANLVWTGDLVLRVDRADLAVASEVEIVGW